MPSFVIAEKCDGCKGQDKTACQYICPNDLFRLNEEKTKAFNQEPEQCWECYCCAKICAQQAIEIRAYADIVPMGGSIIPLRGTDSIMWTVKFRNGNIKRFKFPIRTTPEGSIKPYEGKAQPSLDDIKSENLFSEIGKILPTPAK